MSEEKLYVQYGCGLSAPEKWLNYDSSWNLYIQRLPLLGMFFFKLNGVQFPANIRWGDIVKGLPVEANSCQGVYCSHVLEHLSYEGFEKALVNTFKILKPGGTFRLVMPNFELLVNNYINSKIEDPLASVKFMNDSGMALVSESKSLYGKIKDLLSNSRHQWLWDKNSTHYMLKKVGFTKIRECNFNDCADEMFCLVENAERFRSALAFEAIK